MNRAVKFRIYPDKEQEKILAKTFGCCRLLYNRMLEDKIREYEKNKKMLKNTPAAYKKEFPWLKEVDSLALANVQLHLGKGVMDNGFGQFREMLHYKLEERGKNLVKINRFYPSSKTCSQCGKVKEKLELSERIYVCECGNWMDRDVNAAVNIREEGRRMLCA